MIEKRSKTRKNAYFFLSENGLFRSVAKKRLGLKNMIVVIAAVVNVQFTKAVFAVGNWLYSVLVVQNRLFGGCDGGEVGRAGGARDRRGAAVHRAGSRSRRSQGLLGQRRRSFHRGAQLLPHGVEFVVLGQNDLSSRVAFLLDLTHQLLLPGNLVFQRHLQRGDLGAPVIAFALRLYSKILQISK